jgi:hypothetical protein
MPTNLVQDTLRVLTEVVRCGAPAGPVYRPNEQPHIELFFGTLASFLAHCLPGTTGTGQRSTPEKELNTGASAVVRLDELIEPMAVAIANYNAHPYSSLGGRFPLRR